jgi:hypothetical protein
MIKIIDNFLEDDLSKYLEKYFLEIPHTFGHSSLGLDKGIPFYQANLNPYDPLINFLCLKVQKQIEHKIGFLRVYINVHYSNMPGSFHIDDGDITFMLMTSKTLQKNSGQFQIQINNNVNDIQSVDFIQNRLVIFPAKWKHRGLDPTEHATPRVTLAFKTQRYE